MDANDPGYKFYRANNFLCCRMLVQNSLIMCCQYWRPREADEFYVFPIPSGRDSTVNFEGYLFFKTFFENELMITKDIAYCHQYRILRFLKIFTSILKRLVR